MKSKAWTLSLLVSALITAPHAGAQDYPSKLIRVVVAYPAGATDTAARTVTRPMAALLNQQVIVENKPGAGSAIGAQYVQKAAPDGYTLFWTTDSTHALNPHMYKALSYEPLGYTPIIKTVSTVNVLAVGAAQPVKSVTELLALAKSDPTAASYGSAGVGISNHLAGELLQHVSKVPLVHVPYKGSGPALIDLMGGRIGFMFAGMGHVLPHSRAGKLRIIAVVDTARHHYLPDVPTMDEAGVKGFDLPGIYHAVLAPPNTPRTIVEKLNQTIRAALADKDTAAHLNKQGYDVTPSSPEELGALMRRNFDIWGRLVALAKIEKQ